jgi:hypothetical protein
VHAHTLPTSTTAQTCLQAVIMAHARTKRAAYAVISVFTASNLVLTVSVVAAVVTRSPADRSSARASDEDKRITRRRPHLESTRRNRHAATRQSLRTHSRTRDCAHQRHLALAVKRMQTMTLCGQRTHKATTTNANTHRCPLRVPHQVLLDHQSQTIEWRGMPAHAHAHDRRAMTVSPLSLVLRRSHASPS